MRLNPQAKERLLREVGERPSSDSTSLVHRSLQSALVQAFEALVGYCFNALSLLRLGWRLWTLVVSGGVGRECTDQPEIFYPPSLIPMGGEMSRLVKNLMCAEYAETPLIRRHSHLFIYAMVAV